MLEFLFLLILRRQEVGLRQREIPFFQQMNNFLANGTVPLRFLYDIFSMDLDILYSEYLGVVNSLRLKSTDHVLVHPSLSRR